MKKPKCPFTPEHLAHQGSAWVLANFHTHTPGSLDYATALLPDGKKYTEEKIARGILQDCLDQGIHVLAITDHNSPSFVRVKVGKSKRVADPERESYYAILRRLVRDESDEYGRILVMPGVEISAENIHVLGFFPPSDDPGWDVLKIAAILSDGNCPFDFYGDHLKSVTDFSVADAIDVIHERGGVAIPAHIDGPSGFLKEEDQKRLLKLIVSRPHLFTVEYIRDKARQDLEELLNTTDWKDVFAARQGRPIAWTQSCDAHFVRAFNRSQTGNGKALGTEKRRTWLRIDPDALSFEAVRAALMDPENRVRVDKTSRPRGRQGAYRPLPEDRTYVRALCLDWGRGRTEVMQLNSGINAIVGPPRAGKTARAQAFPVISGTRRDLGVGDPEIEEAKGGASEKKAAKAGKGPELKSIDMLLARGSGAKAALWWLHRETPEHIYVARVEERGKKLGLPKGKQGDWVDLTAEGEFDRRALRRYFWDLPPSKLRLAPTVPRGFSLDDMGEMLADPARVARFIEWQYVSDSLVKQHRELHGELRKTVLDPGAMTAAALAAKLKSLFTELEKPRKKAKSSLNAQYKHMDIGIEATWGRGKWSKANARKAAAQQILALPKAERDYDNIFTILRAIEDHAQVELRMEADRGGRAGKLSKRVETALCGLLLVIGARDLGPVILDGPGTYFEPAELVNSLAPLLLAARDSGAQFVISVDDTNLPFAVDADMLFVCRRDPKERQVGPLDPDATGGLESWTTAMWALRNLDGGGDLFARRRQLYARVLGLERAQGQRKVAEVLLKVSERKGCSKRNRKRTG
jgi:hypothetical protein